MIGDGVCEPIHKHQSLTYQRTDGSLQSKNPGDAPLLREGTPSRFEGLRTDTYLRLQQRNTFQNKAESIRTRSLATIEPQQHKWRF